MELRHRVSVELARLAVEEREGLRTLGQIIVAEQRAEIEVRHRWWASWFGGEPPPPSREEHAAMPANVPTGTVE